jgi:ATP-dependent DNA helicase RecQ
LSYFNEEVDRDCGNCDVCKNPPIRFDASVLAQKALSAIARTNERIAMGMLIDILRGSNNRKIIEHRYHEIKTFGAGRDLKYEEWADYIQQMLNSGIMDIAYDEQHAFKLNNASWSVLKDGKKVQLVRFRPFEEKQAEREANAVLKKKPNERWFVMSCLNVCDCCVNKLPITWIFLHLWSFQMQPFLIWRRKNLFLQPRCSMYQG